MTFVFERLINIRLLTQRRFLYSVLLSRLLRFYYVALLTELKYR